MENKKEIEELARKAKLKKILIYKIMPYASLSEKKPPKETNLEEEVHNWETKRSLSKEPNGLNEILDEDNETNIKVLDEKFYALKN